MTIETQSNSPSHLAYHVREGSNNKRYWTRIGAAWPHRDGNGFNLDIECMPRDGKISLRVPSEKPEEAEAPAN